MGLAARRERESLEGDVHVSFFSFFLNKHSEVETDRWFLMSEVEVN